jgi:DNA-binding NtrC family response regulator
MFLQSNCNGIAAHGWYNLRVWTSPKSGRVAACTGESQSRIDRLAKGKTDQRRDEAMEGKRILIVEDEVRIALALCRALEFSPNKDYEVELSPVGETALDKLQDKPFDLVVTDLRMAGMGGIALIRHVRQVSPQTRTMLITAYGSPEVESAAHRLGAVYMPKPFNLKEFVATVEHILDDEG